MALLVPTVVCLCPHPPCFLAEGVWGEGDGADAQGVCVWLRLGCARAQSHQFREIK